MFLKLVKNIFISLMLLSYASTAISMEQPKPSWWQRLKATVNPTNISKNSAKWPLRSLKAANLLLGNGYFIYKGLNNRFSDFDPGTASSPADLQEYICEIASDEFREPFLELGKEISEVCIKARVPSDTKITLTDDFDGPAAIFKGRYMVVNPLILGIFPKEERKQILAHECMHIINKDVNIIDASDLLAPVLSWGILSSQKRAFNSALDSIHTKYGNTHRLKKINALLTQNFISYFALNSMLTSMVSRNIEIRADRDAAFLLNETKNAISMHTKVMQVDKLFLEKSKSETSSLWKRIKRIHEDHPLFASHPSQDERIKKLKEIQTQLDKKN